jgi:DinB superfamily
MDTLWNTVLWNQFGAAIDTLDNAIAACPASLWTERLWPNPPPAHFPEQFSEFWYVSFHAVVWLDLYLSGRREEEFAPPARFAQGELDSREAVPAQPYAVQDVRGYLASVRAKCHTTLIELTDEQAQRLVSYPWAEGRRVSYLELQFYTLRHVQEHAAQLFLFLGQHGVPDSDLQWVSRAKR